MIAALMRILGATFGLKLFLGGALMTILGIVLYNILVDTIEEILNFVVSTVGSTQFGTITGPTISGFAGWFLAQVKFPECFAVMVSAVVIRFVLRKIPLIRW